MRFEFRFARDTPGTPAPRREHPTLRILALADLGGRASRGEPAATPLERRPLMATDPETLGAVFTRCAPRLRLRPDGASGPEIEIAFERLDDFHPDVLFERLGLFAALRDTRRRLQSPDTFAAAAAELGAVAGGTDGGGNGEGGGEADAETIRRVLGRTPGDGGRPSLEGRLRDDVRQVVRGIVAPYIAAAADPRQDELVASVDQAIGGQMRAVLHHPAFQALEAAWRSIERLVSEVELGEEVQLFLLDATRDEIEADLAAAGEDLEASGLYRLLVDGGKGPWSVVVADYSFGPAEAEVASLAALGALASRMGGPLLAGARPELFGLHSLADTPGAADGPPLEAAESGRWEALRASPWARWIGLALPRVLLRLPYGAKTDATERFAFEELEAGRDHESYLWGNPAFVCAGLLAQSFVESGWAMDPDDRRTQADLPAHAWREDGEPRLMPCAEVVLSARATGAMLRFGVMPFQSFADRNAIELARFQSLADPPAPLAGAWARA